MSDDDVIARVHGLSDVELALLLSLVAHEHPIISTLATVQDELIEELQLIAVKTFGLSYVVVRCTPQTTIDYFTHAILRNTFAAPTSLPYQNRFDYDGYVPQRYSSNLTIPEVSSSNQPASPCIGPAPPTPSSVGVHSNFGDNFMPNIIFVKDLNLAPRNVQIQALELLRSRTLYTRIMHTTPKQWMFIPILAAENGGGSKLDGHLNDMFFITHFHTPEDGFVYLYDDRKGPFADDESVSSSASVVKRSVNDLKLDEATFSEEDIQFLSNLSSQVTTETEVLRYQANIIAFLRLHHAVAHGISPTATKHLKKLCCCLAPLHRIDFVTPALVVLATRKVYLHRITITAPEKERSIQWGSDVKTIACLIDSYSSEDIIEDVIAHVTAPV